jgi:hypothetical protein
MECQLLARPSLQSASHLPCKAKGAVFSSPSESVRAPGGGELVAALTPSLTPLHNQDNLRFLDGEITFPKNPISEPGPAQPMYA